MRARSSESRISVSSLSASSSITSTSSRLQLAFMDSAPSGAASELRSMEAAAFMQVSGVLKLWARALSIVLLDLLAPPHRFHAGARFGGGGSVEHQTNQIDQGAPYLNRGIHAIQFQSQPFPFSV